MYDNVGALFLAGVFAEELFEPKVEQFGEFQRDEVGSVADNEDFDIGDLFCEGFGVGSRGNPVFFADDHEGGDVDAAENAVDAVRCCHAQGLEEGAWIYGAQVSDDFGQPVLVDGGCDESESFEP